MRAGEDVPRNVLALGWALGTPTHPQILSAAGLAPGHDLYRTLRFNKVAAFAGRALATVALPQPARQASARLSEDSSRQAARLKATWPVWERLVAECARDGVTVGLVKGGGVRTWYEHPELRHLGDLDLWLPDEESAWDVVGRLRGWGWDFNPGELPWSKRSREVRGYGVVNLISVSGEQLSVDVHYGDYSVRHCGAVPITADDVIDAGTSRVRLRDEKLLLTVMGNAAGDHFVTMKDINDVVVLAHRGEPDWAEVRSLVRAAGLKAFVRSLIGAAEWVYRSNAEAGGALEVLRDQLRAGPGRIETVGWGRSTSKELRARTTTRHAWEVSKDFGLPSRLAATFTAAVYYRADLRPRLVRGFGGPLPQGAYSGRPWRCVRLVPLNNRQEDVSGLAGLALSSPRPTRTVRRNGDTFLPTVWGRFSRWRL